MKKTPQKQNKEHPEVVEIKNICKIASAGETENICKKIRADEKKSQAKKSK